MRTPILQRRKLRPPEGRVEPVQPHAHPTPPRYTVVAAAAAAKKAPEVTRCLARARLFAE